MAHSGETNADITQRTGGNRALNVHAYAEGDSKCGKIHVSDTGAFLISRHAVFIESACSYTKAQVSNEQITNRLRPRP